MSDDFEIVDEYEEEVTEEVVGYEEVEEVKEEVVKTRNEEEDWGKPPTLFIWLAKLEALRKILKEELKAVNGLEAKAIEESLKEVEREIRYVKCWIENGKPCGGAKEPWRVYQLLKRYGLL